MQQLKPAVFLFIILAVVCGGLYPAVVTTIASLAFPGQAGGSLVTDREDRLVGSRLLGQAFTEPHYFWPRPSATGGFSYNPLASGGSNFGPTNPLFLQTVGERVKLWRDSGLAGTIPAELVEASASGLDPDISPEAAYRQIPRVARARGRTEAELKNLVEGQIEARQWGIFGQPRINVLQLNLALNGLSR